MQYSSTSPFIFGLRLREILGASLEASPRISLPEGSTVCNCAVFPCSISFAGRGGQRSLRSRSDREPGEPLSKVSNLPLAEGPYVSW